MKRLYSLSEQKIFLRKEIRKKLRGLEPPERKRRSREILKKLLSHPKFSAASSVFTYIAMPAEVETQPIFEEALRKGKKVYVPCLDLAKKQIHAIQIVNPKELTPGPYGILEPPFDKNRLGTPGELDLAVVPGLGFDRRGGRIGRGEGYFDRFLKEAKKAYKIGLAFECQMVDKVPRGTNDVFLDEVIVG